MNANKAGTALIIAVAFTATALIGVSSPAAPSPEGAVWFWGSGVGGNQAKLTWQWRTGSAVNARSRITIQYQDGSGWHTLSRNRLVMDKTWTWNASRLNPGKVRTYYLRAIVESSGLRSPRFAYTIDHVPPTVHIRNPQALPSPEGAEASPKLAVVFGKTRLLATYSDSPNWGPAHVYWTVGNAVFTATSSRVDYDFGSPPGTYFIRATAYDFAGNMGVSETIQVLGLPGAPQT